MLDKEHVNFTTAVPYYECKIYMCITVLRESLVGTKFDESSVICQTKIIQSVMKLITIWLIRSFA